MTTNATVEARHKDEAAKAAGFRDYAYAFRILGDGATPIISILAHAQALANLEAARAENADLTNRLAEARDVLRTARDYVSDASRGKLTYEGSGEGFIAMAKEDFARIDATLASGHTPSPCPSCAAKDEAMEAFRREVSVACYVVVKGAGEHYAADANTVSTHLSRFIIPPADPLAEALKAAWTKLWPEDTGIPTACQALRDELAKHGLELSRLGGAK